MELVCLPKNPEWLHVESISSHRSFMYGVEYETEYFVPTSHVQQHDAPCAVCEAVGKRSVIVIPGNTHIFLSFHEFDSISRDSVWDFCRVFAAIPRFLAWTPLGRRGLVGCASSAMELTSYGFCILYIAI